MNLIDGIFGQKITLYRYYFSFLEIVFCLVNVKVLYKCISFICWRHYSLLFCIESKNSYKHDIFNFFVQAYMMPKYKWIKFQENCEFKNSEFQKWI